MPDIAKINAVAIADIEKVDGILAANIAKVNGLTFTDPSINPDAPTSGFLFTYSGAAAAYSVRQLNNNAPYVLRVRRVTGTGNTGNDDEADVKFDTTLTEPAISLDSPVNNFSAGGSNATTLGEFLNVGTVGSTTYSDADSLSPNTAEAYVDAWYDLTGNQNHAEQGTPSAQPQIHYGTVDTDLILENGKPAIEVTASNNQGLAFTPFTINFSDFTAYAVAKFFSDTGAESKVLVLNGYDITRPDIEFRENTVSICVDEFQLGTSTVRAFLNDITFTSSHSQQLHMVTGTNGYVDGSDQGTFTNSGTDADITPYFAGVCSYDYNKDRNSHQRTQEVVIWTTDQDDAGNRTGIDTNIDDYYAIPGM